MAESEDNYKLQLRYLIKKCGEQTFRLLIEKFLNEKGTTLSSFLADFGQKEKISILQSDHVITDEDFELLFYDPASPSFENAGFTLLYVLMQTFFCDVSLDDHIWHKGSKLETNDISRAADVIRIRDHILAFEETEITKDIFAEKYNDLKKIFERLRGMESSDEVVGEETEIPLIAVEDEEENAVVKEFEKWKEMLQRYEKGLDLDVNQSKIRRFRLYSLLVDGGTRVFRHIFDEEIPPKDLQHKLSSSTVQATLKHLGGKITKEQRKLLDCKHTSPKSTTFDITLLAILLRNICSFNSNDKRWVVDNLTSTDKSMIANVTRLREARNQVIAHLSTTGNLTEDDFESHWNKISQILLQLNGCCKVPFGNLQTEIDDLKKIPLDKQLEKKLHSTIEDWKRSDQIILKELKQYIQQSSLESHFVLSKLTVKDVLDDKYFEETNQFKAAKEKLKDNKIIVINGAPGEGKTTVAKKLLTLVSNNQRYVQLHSYADWKNVNIDGVDAILIDDMFGSGTFDKEEYRKWQKHIPQIADAVKSKRLFVIITSRNYILSEAKEKMYLPSIFTKDNIFTLTSKLLTKCEKRGILQKLFDKSSEENVPMRERIKLTEHSDIINEIVELDLSGSDPGGHTIGFPECTRLFSSSVSLYEKGVEFYKAPMTCVKSYIAELLGKNDDTLIAFFVLWAQKTKSLSSLDLERPFDETAQTIIEPIRKLQFHPEKYFRKIRNVLRQHKGGFINFDRNNESFSFSHRVVQDAVGLVSYEVNPTAVIELSDSSFIENYIRIIASDQNSLSSRIENMESFQFSPQGNGNLFIDQLKIHLRPVRYSQFSYKLMSLILKHDLQNIENLSIFKLSVFDDMEFCSKFLDSLDKEECLQRFLLAKTRSLQSEFAEFSFLKHFDTEMGILSYLFWIKEKICPFVDICLNRMVSIGLAVKSEIGISLLVAVKLNQYELVKYFLEKGAEVSIEHISLAIVSISDQNSEKNILELLLKYKNSVSKNYILHVACKRGYFEVVSTLINDGIDKKQTDDDGKSLIENAISGGHAEIFKFIIQTQLPEIDFKIVVRGEEMPFYHVVVARNKADLIDVLTYTGFRPTKVDKKGQTPFLYAIKFGKVNVLERLFKLSHDEKVHCLPDNDQNTPLHVVIKKIGGSSEYEKDVYHKLALRLCSVSYNINNENYTGETPLELACNNGLVEIANAILSKEDPFLKQRTTLFHHFVTKGNFNVIKTLLKCNIDPNKHDLYHRTPFMLANVLGKHLIIDLLQKDPRIKQYNEEIGIVPKEPEFIVRSKVRYGSAPMISDLG